MSKSESVPEAEFWAATRRRPTLKHLRQQHRVGPYRLDFALPHMRFGVEVDGLAYHGDQESFEADRKRQRDLEQRGWRILRFTAREVSRDPDACVAEVVKFLTKLRRRQA